MSVADSIIVIYGNNTVTFPKAVSPDQIALGLVEAKYFKRSAIYSFMALVLPAYA